ncbi:hypothetical protein [Zobellia roscoffensis]|uniref:hypothetical protein n=1 Tax=Zobellia roscoffensis TaxID=2779508 RepID=UPI00188AE3CE|nr:hypothetical protein [Zobellia roscoffensis]
MRKVYVIFLLFSVTILHSQETAEFELLGTKYQYLFEKGANKFSICKISSDEKSCKVFTLKNNDAFALPEMQSHLKDYFTELRDSLSTYDSLKLTLNVETLKKDALDAIYFNQPVSLKAFLIELTESTQDTNTYVLKPLNPAFSSIENILLKTSKDTASIKSDLESKIQQFLITSLNNNKNDIIKNVTQAYTNEYDSFYKGKIAKTEDYSYLTTEELKLISSDTTEKFIWYKLISNNIFYLKVIPKEDTGKNTIYGPFELGIGSSDFVSQIIEQRQFAGDAINKVTLEKVYLKVEQPIKELRIQKEKETQRDMLLLIADSIENKNIEYSGSLTLNKEFILTAKDKHPKVFKVDSATISFFNNRADMIVIEGTVDGKKEVLINNNYSLPLRAFNDSTQTNSLGDYSYSYGNIFCYGTGKTFNYAIKNDEIKLTSGKSVKLKQRDLMDYFTGIIFSDFLGLNNNTNGIIIAEAQMRLPLNLVNYKYITFFDNITFYLTANLFGGLENGNRKIKLEDVNSKDPESFLENDPYMFKTDNFNLLLNNSIDGGIRTSIFTYEIKRASTFMHIRYGLRFLSTGVEYNLNESITSENGNTVNSLYEKRDFRVFAIGQEIETNFEIRPQSDIGADLTIGLNWFGATGTNKNDIKFNTYNNSPNLKVMANLYSLVNPNNSKSGLFFRLGGHYDLGNYDLYPQIMVGYATNLTSFINKVQSK